MKRIGFIGAADKSNLIICVAKVIASMGKSILVIDTTATQKLRYIVPKIEPTKTYVTQYEGIDFAIGFENMEDIQKYLAVREEKIPYDYVIIDVDSGDMLTNFKLENAKKNYFVTDFDMYSLRKGVEILDALNGPMVLTKVLYSYEVLKEDEEYLNYIALGKKIVWDNYVIYMPKAESDFQTIEENQRVFAIKIKKLSANYQDGIISIAQKILEEKNLNKIRKSIKE